MRTTFWWRFVKFSVASAVLVLSAYLLLSPAGEHTHGAEPPTLSAGEYRLLSPDSYRYLLNQPAVCRETNPFLVFLVPVGPRDAAFREAVRRTWGGGGGGGGGGSSPGTATLFFTGLPEGGPGSAAQEELEEESRRWGDIIQVNFVDSYHNLTIKTVLMMRWLETHCSTASYAMKVDADIFVNVFLLLDRLRRSPREGFITGSVIRDGRPRRDPNSKWYLSEELYPEDGFPPYVSGAGYVFSIDLAARISWASRFVRVIPLEDVYVGLCLRVLGVRPVYSYSLPSFRNLFEIRNLKYDRCTFSRLVIVNGFKPSELLQAWDDFSKGHESCSGL